MRPGILPVLALGAAALTACGNRPTRVIAATSPATPAASAAGRSVTRLNGTVQAVRAFIIQTPQIWGAGGGLILMRLAPNGTSVRQGDILAEFDSTAQVKAARDASAKADDLSHQIEQKIAEQRSNRETRTSQLLQAEADLAKAQLEIRKGPILSAIEDQKNAVKLEDANEHAASLRKSNHFHDLAEAAELKILELQHERQQVAVQRAEENMQKLTVRAPLAGMVALENVWKQGTMGHPQEGDQLYPGSPLLRIFDPSEMRIELKVSEPDDARIVPGTEAVVHLDAYPDLAFKAVFETASPVASSSMDSSLKTFAARFRFVGSDPHLLPDLSAAVDIPLKDGRR